MIRAAVIQDLEQLEPCARAFYASSAHLKDFDMPKFIALWTALLTNGSGGLFLLFEGSEVEGAIGGVIYPEAYSDAQICQEFFWFVKPESRGGGVRLYRKFEEWARTKGANEIRMGYLVDSMPEKVSTFYERLGFHPVEVNYTKVLTCAG